MTLVVKKFFAVKVNKIEITEQLIYSITLESELDKN
jgi:hypothetical protein